MHARCDQFFVLTNVVILKCPNLIKRQPPRVMFVKSVLPTPLAHIRWVNSKPVVAFFSNYSSLNKDKLHEVNIKMQ